MLTLLFLLFVIGFLIWLFSGKGDAPEDIVINTVNLIAPRQSTIANMKVGQWVQVYGEISPSTETHLTEFAQGHAVYSVTVMTQKLYNATLFRTKYTRKYVWEEISRNKKHSPAALVDGQHQCILDFTFFDDRHLRKQHLLPKTLPTDHPLSLKNIKDMPWINDPKDLRLEETRLSPYDKVYCFGLCTQGDQEGECILKGTAQRHLLLSHEPFKNLSP